MDLIRRLQEQTCQCPTGVGTDCFFVDSASECPVCNPTDKSGKTTTTTKSNKFSKSAPALPSTMAMTTHLVTNKDLSIDCIQSSHTSAMTKLRGMLALLAIQAAVKVTSDDNQILMLMVASILLDCPNTTDDDSSYFGLVCEQIDTAVLSVETKKERKLLEGKDTVIPWTEPNDDVNDIELLVNDPGVWAVNNFLDMEEVNKLKHLLQKHGDSVGDSPCGLPDGRKCYWFTAADGLPNNNYFDEEDLKFFMQIRANVQDLWPQFNIRDGTGVYDVPEGKTDPYIPPYHGGVSMDTSDDKYWPATTIIYLEDGDGDGGDTIFPYAGSDGLLVVTPKEGMAVTWLVKCTKMVG